MSNHDNARRAEEKRTEHGPRWETRECDAPSVAHARKSWKKIKSRTERRTGQVSPKVHMCKHKRPRPDVELEP